MAYHLPGGLSWGRYFAFRVNQTHGRRLDIGATAAVKQFIVADPALLEHVRADRISHRKFAKYFGFDRNAVDRAYRSLGWRTTKLKTPMPAEEIALRRDVKECIERLKNSVTAPSWHERHTHLSHCCEKLTKLIERECSFAPTNVPLWVPSVEQSLLAD